MARLPRYTLDGQLIKTNWFNEKSIQKDLLPASTSSSSCKECYNVENNIIIFLDHKIVERFGIRDGTQFEQIPTEEGILLRQRKQRRD